jgi:hypothetical protein
MFQNSIKTSVELIVPGREEHFFKYMDIAKSCYIKLFGKHVNSKINIIIDDNTLLSVVIPDTAIAVRVHLGLVPLLSNNVIINIDYPLYLQRRYSHGLMIDNPYRPLLRKRSELIIKNKISIKAYYDNGSEEFIGNADITFNFVRGGTRILD